MKNNSLKNDYNKIRFQEGYTIVQNVPSLLIPLNTAIILHKNIKNKIDKEKFKIISHFLYKDIISKKTTTIQKTKQFLEKIEAFGYGKLSIVKISKDKTIIINENPIFRNTRKKLFPEVNTKNKTSLEEMLIYFFQKIFKSKIELEIKDKKNKTYMTFFYTQNSLETINESSSYEIKKIKDNKSKYNKLLTKVLIDKQLNIINGEIKIWKVNLVAIPLNIFTEEKDNNKNEELKNILINIAKEQGAIATEFQIKKTGKKEEEIILNSILLESELVGTGTPEKYKYDPQNHTYEFNVKESHFHNNLFKWYLLGIFIGSMQYLYNKKASGTINKETFKIKIEKTSNKKTENHSKNLKKMINI